jgi:hypothetical protein
MYLVNIPGIRSSSKYIGYTLYDILYYSMYNCIQLLYRGRLRIID